MNTRSYVKTGRQYYTSSNANIVDPTDIQYAKVFPTMRSAKAAAQWAGPNVKYFRVNINITIEEEVEFK